MTWLQQQWPRLLGLSLLGILLWQIDGRHLFFQLRNLSMPPFVVAVILNIPQISIKGVRWRWLLRSQRIQYGIGKTLLAYFSSIFIGLLTPGRLGEFVKALYVSQDCNVSSASAVSSVLLDRLFDFYTLLFVGMVALLRVTVDDDTTAIFSALVFLLILPLVLFLNDSTFRWLQNVLLRPRYLRKKLKGAVGWMAELRQGLLMLKWPSVLAGITLTVFSYSIFFGQCYLLAMALDLQVGFTVVTCAVALGSLVALLPISISGLGTREAAIVAYLAMADIPPEAALGFSLLIFVTFYIGGGLLGALAWSIKPVKLTKLWSMKADEQPDSFHS